MLKGKSGKILESLIKIIGIASVLPVFIILGYIIYKGIPSVTWQFISEMPKRGMRAGGILPAILGTIYLTLGTIAVAVPCGVFTGVYLVEYAKDNFFTRVINLTIINLAGIPSIIYGLFGMALFVIQMKLGVSIISGALTLGIMSLPVIIASTKEALLAVPKNLREASLALGSTKWETISKVVLPAACDLRRLITLINSAKTMERIGDLLKANTCLTKEISKKYPQLVIYLGNEILFLVKEVKKIYELYNKSFLYSDVENMHKLLNLDLDINKIVKKNYEVILEKMTENPEIIKGGFLLLMLNKKYERISDHIIHMDKDLIYASTGKNIRKMQLMGKI